MNIVFTRFPYESAYGGEEYHTLAIAKHYVDIGHFVSFFGSCPALSSLFTSNGLPSKKIWFVRSPVTIPALLVFLLLLPFLWLYVAVYFVYNYKSKIDVLYALGLPDKILLTPIAKMLGAEVIWIEHQMLGEWLLKSPLRYMYAYCSKWIKIIPISQYNAEILHKRLGINTAVVQQITNGIDTQFFTPSNTVNSKKCITFNGRLEDEKGVLQLLSAFRLIHAKHPNVHLRINGTGSLLMRMQEYIQKHNLHEFVTLTKGLTRDELLSLYQSTSVFVLPSTTHHETFGLVAAEAISCGATPVITNTSGISTTLPQLLQQFVVPPNDLSQLVQSILRALHKPVAPNTLHNIAVTQYSSARMLQQYQQLLCTT